MKTYFDQLYLEKIQQYRQGHLSFDQFCDWFEPLIEEKRQKGYDLITVYQDDLYLSFASRAGHKQHLAVEALEQGFELVSLFIEQGGQEEALLDQAFPFFESFIKDILESIELNEECLELDGGVTGTI